MPSAQHHLNPSDRSGFEAVVRDPCRARHFLDDEVPREDIEHIVELAMCATSICDTQAWRFVAVRDPEVIGAMQAAVLERFEELALRPGIALQQRKRTAARAQALMFAKAPLCIAVLALPSNSPIEQLMELAGMTQEEHDRLCVRPELQSAGAAVQLLTTSAHAMGYATCWTCAPLVAGERLENLLRVTPPSRLVALVAIGRPSEQPTASKRLPLEQALTFRRSLTQGSKCCAVTHGTRTREWPCTRVPTAAERHVARARPGRSPATARRVISTRRACCARTATRPTVG